MTTEPDLAARLIPLDGTVNFRDIGGYGTADGRTTKWRTVFRADGLNHLSDADLVVLDEIGIATVFDLRTLTEVELGHFPTEGRSAELVHVPLMETVSNPEDFTITPGMLAATYLDMANDAGHMLVKILSELAHPTRVPAIVHCTAGKDRTGVTIAVLLSVLGVPRETVVRDYALSAFAMVHLVERLKERYPAAADVLDNSQEMFSAAPANIELLLDHLDSAFGSPTDFVIAAGLHEAQLDQLAMNLLE